MIHPLRPEAKSAVETCRNAGIEVAMVTGDHPVTAFAIAQALGLAKNQERNVTGPQLRATSREADIDRLSRHAPVFARVEPSQNWISCVHSSAMVTSSQSVAMVPMTHRC
jgi:magnesium-transporting ATPase (P-type)